MKKSLYTMITVIFFIVISGCNNNGTNDEHDHNNEVPQMIDVQLTIKPEQPNPNEEVLFTAKVSQAGNPVDDADDVSFEIWRENEEEHEMLEALNRGNGEYLITRTLDKPGKYYVISHVSARGMHNMPQKEFNVGPVDEVTAVSPTPLSKEVETHEHGDTQHHGNEDIQIIFMNEENIKSEEDTVLSVQIKKAGHALKGAEVLFEVWREGQTSHRFIDLLEKDEGLYSVIDSFSNKGSHYIKVHVKKNELHTHQDHMITVH